MAASEKRTDLRPPSLDTTESEVLRSFLDYLRSCLVRKLDGLDEQAARHPGVESGTNLLGLVQHMTAGESYWFEHVLGGARPDQPDFTMQVPGDRSIAMVVADLERAVERSNHVLDAFPDLGLRAVRAQHGNQPRTVRWILVHTIEEYARHAGHADIIREQLDGATGR
ncbi:MAG: DinB family protein [Marmoricola sp.]